MFDYIKRRDILNSYKKIHKKTSLEFYSKIKKEEGNIIIDGVEQNKLNTENNKYTSYPIFNINVNEKTKKEIEKLKKKYEKIHMYFYKQKAYSIINFEKIKINEIELNKPLDEALKFIFNLWEKKDSLENNIFGILLKPKVIKNKKSWIINPLHPFTMYNINNLQTNYNYDVITYEIDKGIFDESMSTESKNELRNDTIKAISFLQNHDSHIIKYIKKVNIDDEYKHINIDTIYIDNKGNNVEINQELRTLKALIPVQYIIMKGMIYPAYGLVYMEGTDGISFTPMLHSNISNGGITVSHYCSGNYMNSSLSGIRTLNELNLDSPYIHNIFYNNYIEQINIMGDISRDIYNKNIVFELENNNDILSHEEIKEFAPEFNMIDYIKYTKTFIKKKEKKDEKNKTDKN